MKTGITFGTFDVFHYGHLRLIERARSMCDRLVVGVSSDELNFSKKGRFPYYSLAERMAIVRSLRFVDDVFVEESLDMKEEYVRRYGAGVLVMGDDWRGRFDFLANLCEVVYLPRTPGISTTAVIERITSSVL